MSEVHVWESSQIWRREDGAIVEDRQGKHYSSDPNEAFIHVVLLADYTALRAEVERLLGLLGRTRVCVQAELGEYKIFLKRPGMAPDAYVFGLRRLAECDALLTEVAAVLRAAPPTTGSR